MLGNSTDIIEQGAQPVLLRWLLVRISPWLGSAEVHRLEQVLQGAGDSVSQAHQGDHDSKT